MRQQQQLQGSCLPFPQTTSARHLKQQIHQVAAGKHTPNTLWMACTSVSLLLGSCCLSVSCRHSHSHEIRRLLAFYVPLLLIFSTLSFFSCFPSLPLSPLPIPFHCSPPSRSVPLGSPLLVLPSSQSTCPPPRYSGHDLASAGPNACQQRHVRYKLDSNAIHTAAQTSTIKRIKRTRARSSSSSIAMAMDPRCGDWNSTVNV